MTAAKKPDYMRVLNLLESDRGTYYPTYRIAEVLNIQANTVQRCINDDLIRKLNKPIIKKRVVNSRTMSYAILDSSESVAEHVEEELKEETKTRESCPNKACQADEFFIDEIKEWKHRKRVPTGVLQCSCCGHKYRSTQRSRSAGVAVENPFERTSQHA